MAWITKRMPGLDGEEKFYVFKTNVASYSRANAQAVFSEYETAKITLNDWCNCKKNAGLN